MTNKIEISDDYPNMSLRGRVLNSLDKEQKLSVWRYSFSVEFVEQENEALINDIFNRINRNVAKLTSQELRHARFSGRFISAAETLTEQMDNVLPTRFPNIMPQSKRQMKDVENVATMLLFIEIGEKSLSQSDVDTAFSDREEEWPEEKKIIEAFNKALTFIADVLKLPVANNILSSRLRNQADFYSLFAAVRELQNAGECPTANNAALRLSRWVDLLRSVEREEIPATEAPRETRYLEAARAASNDSGPRRVRIDVVKAVLLG